MRPAITGYWRRTKATRSREQSGIVDRHATGADRHRPDQIASWSPNELGAVGKGRQAAPSVQWNGISDPNTQGQS